ncbi:MAG: right-handed parallel beta-helix repeat-containing protein [Akkermansiaceae bacterium]
MRLFSLCLLGLDICHGKVISDTPSLLQAAREAQPGSVLELAAGSYQLSQALELPSGVTLKGAGMGKTIITHVPEWKPDTKGLPDPETQVRKMDDKPFLIRLKRAAKNISISHLTLHAPMLHGALYGIANEHLHIHHVRVRDALASGLRFNAISHARIHDCEFIDAGGRWANGEPGINGGITGGGIFAVWMKDSEISHNRFTRTKEGKEHNYYGIKGRQGKRVRIHHNTIEVNFSIEFPFENDQDVEIDHNICAGTISIPKHAGGPVPESGRTFHIHHNYFRDTYAIEFVRNGVEISHNLFDFPTDRDHGNLISAFGKAPAKGPAIFHNNLVKNPGRGLIWMNEPYAHLTVRNNHIITNTTATPRKDGLFGFNPNSDFSTFLFKENIIECSGLTRPLFRNEASYRSQLEGNRLINVSDSDRFKTTQKAGLEAPLKFTCGVRGEITVDGWTAKLTPKN